MVRFLGLRLWLITVQLSHARSQVLELACYSYGFTVTGTIRAIIGHQSDYQVLELGAQIY